MSDATQDGPVLAADGTPLKRSLARALRMQKLRALALIAPLLLFVLLTFIAPIADMLFRSIENQMVSATIPATVHELSDWDGTNGETPGEDVFEALYFDLFLAAEAKEHTKLGTRLNYEKTGVSSLFRSSGRKLDDLGKDYQKAFKKIDKQLDEDEQREGCGKHLTIPSMVNAQIASADKETRTVVYQTSGGDEVVESPR